MKELAIGEEIRIKCVEDNSNRCMNCCFCNMDCEGIKELVGHCSGFRSDGKKVHFELVEN